MSTLGPSLVEEDLSSHYPSSGKLCYDPLSQVYPPHTAAEQRSQGQALGLRAGQTCGTAYLLEPSAELAKVDLQQAQPASLTSCYQKNLTSCPQSLSSLRDGHVDIPSASSPSVC